MAKSEKIGSRYKTKEGYEFTVVSSFPKKINGKTRTFYECDFGDGLVLVRESPDINTGRIKNPLHKSVCGVGFIGVGEFEPKIDKKAYLVWSSMIRRCYSEKVAKSDLSYNGVVSVSSEWHNFQTFAKWFYENYKDGWSLDKDLLSGCKKLYSEKTCVFLPQELNVLISDTKIEGNCVNIYRNGKMRVSMFGKHIGYFDTLQECRFVIEEEVENKLSDLEEKYFQAINNVILGKVLGKISDKYHGLLNRLR